MIPNDKEMHQICERATNKQGHGRRLQYQICETARN